jgi:hypothetical protein
VLGGLGDILISTIPLIHDPFDFNTLTLCFFGFLKGLQIEALGAIGMERG